MITAAQPTKKKNRLADTAFPDAGCLAPAVAEVIQARSADPAPGDQFDFLDSRIVQGKGLFHANTMGDFANRVGGVHVSALALDDNALENLDTLFAALDDTDMHFNGVTRPEVGMVEAHLLQIYFVNYFAHNPLPSW
jgi:hypothetical protein